VHFTEYHTRLAAYAAIVNDAGELLLTWFNGGTDPSNAGWSLPGGGVEYDEGIEDAVVREVHEETGYTVEVGPLLVLHHFTSPTSWRGSLPYRSQRFVFHGRVVGGELGTVEVGGTTDFARWVPLADVPPPEPTAELVRIAVRHLRERRR